MSTSPRLSAARRVDSSGITRNTSVLTAGGLRQYRSWASRVSSTPGLNETNLYGPAPTGRLLEALVADLLHVLLRHDPGRAGGGRRVEGQEVGPGLLEAEADAQRIDDLDRGDLAP